MILGDWVMTFSHIFTSRKHLVSCKEDVKSLPAGRDSICAYSAMARRLSVRIEIPFLKGPKQYIPWQESTYIIVGISLGPMYTLFGYMDA